MKLQIKIPPIIGIVILITLMITACSSSTPILVTNHVNGHEASISNNLGKDSTQTISDVLTTEDGQSLPADMVAFEGSVFVASTKPKANQWERAGWQISRNSQKIEVDQVPADCTLYKHHGVEDQWIGNCSGYILIPKDGANHIAVMHTQADGTSILVQVSPPPD